MKKLYPLLSVLFLIYWGCSSQEPINFETTLIDTDKGFFTKDTNKPYNGPVFSLHENGQIKVEVNLKNGLPTGLFSRYYESGKKKFEGNSDTLIDGEFLHNGLHTFWYENGQKSSETNFKDGEKDGPYNSWYKNGQKEIERTFKNGKWVGLNTSWYENGQMMIRETYKDGKFEGEFFEWYKNGNKKSEGISKNGIDISIKRWNEDGSVKE